MALQMEGFWPRARGREDGKGLGWAVCNQPLSCTRPNASNQAPSGRHESELGLKG